MITLFRRRPVQKPPSLLDVLDDTIDALERLRERLPPGEIHRVINHLVSLVYDVYEDEMTRSIVSRQWAKDWDSAEDACYDA